LLEQKVQERTLELQNALKEVNDKEEKLQEYAYRLENSNRELTEFAHIASHDLKAPLRSIMSFAQLFERRNINKFDDTDREYFNFIKSNATQSARLIEDLLNYSKIDKNLGEPVAVDINKCIFIAEMNMQSLLREKNAVIQYENLPILRGHTSLITQLFQNLINNGIKYNKSAQPCIKIGLQRNERNECVFSVSDNGIGIAAENFDKVFAMFRRLHTQTEYDGTGIGLSFCTRIVETYGGKIWLESEIEKGTTFYFTLPKAKMPIMEIAA
jgi:light-regulated signal transduction histidine kinase (bacteriophytochrome)